MHYLDNLNEVQKQAVIDFEGPIMINAGPGSGKTRVLTYRIAFMMEQGIQPYNILALTFTNKSSREMKERIEALVGKEARSLFMGTFHSVFARILRPKASMIGYTSDFSIYDTEDSKSVLKQIIKDMGLNEDLYKANYIYNRISSLKNNLINPKIYKKNDFLQAEDAENNRPKLGEIFEEYCKQCFKNNAMDFDDLQLKFFELIVRKPEVLYELQHKFHYIMVDEFQDTNFAQYKIVRKIADVHQNICMVGDDSQSIYGFRGASIDNILNFQKDYDEVKVFKLEQNYRSTQNIVNAANHIIKKNKFQIEKTIWTDNNEGGKIKVFQTFTDNDEGKQVVDFIFETSMNNQLSYNDIAILYRTNYQSRAFEEALRRKNIPYIIYGGTSFYQRKEVKDLLAYLKLIVNPYDEEALKRTINFPLRGIGKVTYQKMALFAQENDLKPWDVVSNIEEHKILPEKTAEKVTIYATMLKVFQNEKSKNAYEIASELAKSSGLVRELNKDKSVEGLSRFENLEELLNSIKEFVENDEVIEGEDINDKSLGTFLQSVMLLTDKDTQEEDTPSVKLMTIHASKGLEFDTVCLVGLEEDLFPSKRSMFSEEQIEEERRLFYVAVTRAEKRLLMSYAMSRYRFGNIQSSTPSRFLSELPKELLEMRGIQQQAPLQTASRSQKSSLVRPNKTLSSLKSSMKVGSGNSNFKSDPPENIKQGQKVQHISFGYGEVKDISGNDNNKIATIQFGKQEKKIMLKYAKLKIID